jgi:hypothetical protein
MSHTEPAAVDIPTGTPASVTSVRPVVLPAPGRGEDLQVSFAEMTPPALVIAGDHDQSLLTVRGPDWWADAYTLSPGDKRLLTLFGAEHSMGGISGYSVTETTDESPERFALIQRVTAAYLRSSLDLGDDGWLQVRTDLQDDRHPLGRLESR